MFAESEEFANKLTSNRPEACEIEVNESPLIELSLCTSGYFEIGKLDSGAITDDVTNNDPATLIAVFRAIVLLFAFSFRVMVIFLVTLIGIPHSELYYYSVTIVFNIY